MSPFSRQSVLLAVFSFFVAPLLVYYLTTLLFWRTTRSTLRNKTPPTVPYHVPGIFHAFGLANTGPQKYFTQAMKDYGDNNLAPFFVNAGPQRLLVLREPQHVASVLERAKDARIGERNAELFDKVFGSPQAAVDLYAGRGVSDADRFALEHAHSGLLRKHLTGSSLVTNIEQYMLILSKDLNNKMFQVGTWTQIEDTWSFLQQIVARCMLQFMFGSDLFKQYPQVLRDYWSFQDDIEGFVPGFPRYWVPSAASQARDRVLQGLEKWLKANHSGSEFARIKEEDPVWDELKGSKYLQERDDLLARLEVMDLRARAAEMLAIMHESCSTIVPNIIWTVLEVLRKPELAKSLTTNISQYSPSHGATYNVESLTKLPLVESLTLETVRLRMASLISHLSKESLQLDQAWTAPRETPIMIFSHDLSLDTAAWTKARSRTTDRPLEEYWPERFVMANALQRKHATAPSFSMNGLEHLNINASDFSHPLLGWDYAKSIHASTLTVLLSEFEPQLCDPDVFDAALPPARDIAFGMLKPLEKVAMRIRKRPGI